MKCVTTVKYQIKVNRGVMDVIIPQRGLRQGDPLSPYLFLICAEGFSALLNEAEANGRLKGIQICRQAPSVSHLLFADDSLLLMEANANAAREVNNILSTYEACSGQMINKEKSAILFSKNTVGSKRNEMKRILGINVEGFRGKYLGLSVYIGKNKARAFNYIKEKVWKIIHGWKEKLLSKAGKEVLIKVVAQAIPVYAMAYFDLTKSFCEELSAIIGRYWWSQMDKTNNIHWVSWDIISKPKVEGGLGFRNLHYFNLAMLARQAWRILQNPCSLCTQVLAAKYFPDGSILEAKPMKGISYSWRSILKGVQLLKKGIIWRVGNGENIRVWEDPWIPRGSTRKISSPKGRNLIGRVSELINPITNQWDADLIKQTFWPEDANIILQIPIQEQTCDFLAWHYDKKGLFSVKSAYMVAVDNVVRESSSGLTSTSNAETENSDFDWKKLWALPLPSKVRHFLWRIATYSLPLRTKLKRKGMPIDTRCPVCFRFDEDGGHIFLKCKKVRELWRTSMLEHIRIKLLDCPDSKKVLEEIFKLELGECLKVCFLMWLWWNERNKANNGDQIRSIGEVSSSAEYHVFNCMKDKTQEKEKSNRKMQKWKPPPEGNLKININGAFIEASKIGGWGFTLRNDQGVLLAAGAGKLKHVSDSLHAEALALQHATNIAISMGCKQVIFETDSMMLKQAITSTEYDLSKLGSLFQDVKFQMRVGLIVVSFEHCNRECNRAAHILAMHGLGERIDMVD